MTWPFKGKTLVLSCLRHDKNFKSKTNESDLSTFGRRWKRKSWGAVVKQKEGEIQNEFLSMSTGRVARHCLLISLPMVRSIHIHPVRTGHHCTTIRNISTITMNCLLLSPRVTAIYVDTANRICFFTICHYTNDNRSPPLSVSSLTLRSYVIFLTRPRF